MGLLNPRKLIILAFLAVILLPKLHAAGEFFRFSDGGAHVKQVEEIF